MKPDFRELTGEIFWKGFTQTARRTFACARYEVVSSEALLKKTIGSLNHPNRIQLLEWLKGRY